MTATDTPSSPDGASLDAGSVDRSEDLEAARKAVEDAATVSTGLWVSYLFMFFYVSVAAGAVTHADLLLENAVRLPFLIIELPLLAFFLIAPLMFLIMHAYTLVHLVLLSRKSIQFHDLLYAEFPNSKMARITAEQDRRNRLIRDDIRRRLPSNIFVQFLAGPSEIRNTRFGMLLRLIAWITLVFGPIALMLEIQIQFLPYHLLWLTWLHRFALILDLLLLWWLWGKIVGGALARQRWPLPSSLKKPALGASSIVIAWFACCIAIIPGEWQEFFTIKPLYRLAFYGEIDPNTHRRLSLLSNTLELPRFNVYDALKVDDPRKVAWRESLLSLRGRELDGANFDEAFLERTDAQGAHLQGASFKLADLRGSSLIEADLRGSYFDFARLQGATFIRAKLAGATLNHAYLQGSNLTAALLQGADLSYALLRGSSLRQAKLSGASLDNADLEGSSLAEADLQGATFVAANIKIASFDRARLWRAVFRDASMMDLFGTPSWIAQENGPDRLWAAKSYAELRSKVLQIADEDRRTYALQGVGRLDCSIQDPDTSSCDRSKGTPSQVAVWQQQLSNASVSQQQYKKATAGVLFNLFCSGNYDALLIVRTLATMADPSAGKMVGILEAGSEAKELVEKIMNEKQCNVATQLTDADRFKLFAIKNAEISATDKLK